MCEGEVIVHEVTVFGVARECENSWLVRWAPLQATSYKPLELHAEGGRWKIESRR